MSIRCLIVTDKVGLEAFGRIQSEFKTLNSLEFYNSDLPHDPDLWPLAFPTVTKLKMWMLKFEDGKHFTRILRSFPNLETLTCGGIYFDNIDIAPPTMSCLPTSLRTLGLIQIDINEPFLFDFFLSQSIIAQLSSLYLRLCNRDLFLSAGSLLAEIDSSARNVTIEMQTRWLKR